MTIRTIFLNLTASVVLVLAVPATAQTKPDPRLLEQFRRVTLPQFHDALGWRQPMYYSTIQTADIDGDGRSEILARWIDGLHVYRFTNGTWLSHSVLTALSDNEGFTNPAWYSSIHTAVLDPQLRQADVIARKGDGVHVYRYDVSGKQWTELGIGVRTRPFADASPGTTPAVDLTAISVSMRSADLTKDNSAELVGLGPNGVEVHKWNTGTQSWSLLATSRVGTSQNSSTSAANASTLQLIDVDQDGIAELLVGTPTGIETYRWTDKGWTAASTGVSFRTGTTSANLAQVRSIRATVDATGTAWLHGLVQGNGGVDSGAIQVHRWRNGAWQAVNTIYLPGSGWNEESQSSTLMAADIQGDATPEFLVRGSDGLRAYTSDGRPLAVNSGSFTDAQGWNLPEHYQTIRSVLVRTSDAANASPTTLIFGRGRSGIEMYRFASSIGVGAWQSAPTSGFPNFCVDPNSGQCSAFKAFSASASAGDNIRNRYGEASDATPNNLLANLPLATQPAGVSDTDFKTVRDQLQKEINALNNVHAWFSNNAKVMTYMYGQSANSLNEIFQKVTLAEAGAENAQVGAKWAAFALNIIGEVAGAFLGEELTLVTGILSEVIDKAAEATENGGEEARKTYGELSREVNDQQDKFTLTNGTAETAWLTDWGKLQQIAALASPEATNWTSQTPDSLAKAQVASSQGLKRWAYKPLASAAWHVWACRRGDLRWLFGGCDPAPDYPDQFYCQYGANFDSSQGNNAYVVKRDRLYPRLDALQDITGTGPNNYNISYYPYMLAGLDDWELESSDEELRNALVRGAGAVPPTYRNGCFGAGSRAGLQHVTEKQSVTERLVAAHVNYKLVYTADLNGILRSLRALRQSASQLSPDHETRNRLDAPLREAINSLQSLREPLSPEQRDSSVVRSVPGGRPGRMVQAFIMRVQGSTELLGQSTADKLNAQAHQLLAQLDVPDTHAPVTAQR